MNIEKFMAGRAGVINRALALHIKRIPACHPRLMEAMLYSLDAGGGSACGPLC